MHSYNGPLINTVKLTVTLHSTKNITVRSFMFSED